MKLSQTVFFRLFLILILIISLGLRLALAFQGGQFFNPDEYRYLYSREVAHDFEKHGLKSAIYELTREADHQGFEVLGMIPALVEVEWGENPVIPALFFGLFSWINIILIWFLAKRLGADEIEALLASFIIATSNALFYYSAHIFPYDAAMTFGLIALYVGLHHKFSIWRSVLTGVFSFATFYIYNGYWALAAFALIAHTLFSLKPLSRTFSKALFAVIGFLISLSIIIWIGLQADNNLLAQYVEFSKTIKNGVFSDGGILPFAYLWATEGINFILWLLLMIFAIFNFSSDRSSRIITYVGATIFFYASLFIPSVILHKFVVYGRLVRLLVPFLALIGGYSIRKLQNFSRWGRTITLLIFAIVIIQTSINLRGPFLITYPRDFILQIREHYPDFKPPKNITFFYTPDVIEVGPYEAFYIKYISKYKANNEKVEGVILMSAEHPLNNFPPFRYEEGFPVEKKISFPKNFPRMMLVRPNK